MGGSGSREMSTVGGHELGIDNNPPEIWQCMPPVPQGGRWFCLSGWLWSPWDILHPRGLLCDLGRRTHYCLSQFVHAQDTMEKGKMCKSENKG